MNIKHFLIVGLAFLAFSCQNNDGMEGVTPSGYKYKIHTNAGTAVPQPGEIAYFHAQMRNDNEVVNSSRDQAQEPFIEIPVAPDPARPATPVEEILKQMGVGDSATIFIDLDTIPNKPQGFENSKMMYYDIVLTSIKTAEEFAADKKIEQEAKDAEAAVIKARAPEVKTLVDDIVAKYANGELDAQLQTTSSGLKYLIQEEGTGKTATPGQTVSVQYYGALTDGNMFDNSFDRGLPIQFPLGVGRVIPGWDEGIGLLKEGSKATFFIPYDLAYGEAGSPPNIPAKAELIFYVELEKVN